MEQLAAYASQAAHRLLLPLSANASANRFPTGYFSFPCAVAFGFALAFLIVPKMASADDYSLSFNDLARSARVETYGLLQTIQNQEAPAKSALQPPDSTEQRAFKTTDDTLSKLQKLAPDLQLSSAASNAVTTIKSQIEKLQADLSANKADTTELNAVKDNVDASFKVLLQSADLSWYSPQRVVFPVTRGQLWTLTFLIFIATWLALVPPVIFLKRGYKQKVKQISNVFDPLTCQYYFEYYWANTPLSKASRKQWLGRLSEMPKMVWQLDPADSVQAALLTSELTQTYRKNYGRGKYIVPLIMLMLVLLAAIGLVARSGLYFCQNISPSLTSTPPHILLNYVPMAALAGAYLWVAGDGLQRTRINDYLPSDLYAHVLRIVVAIPMGYAVGFMAAPELASFVAFAIGTFPLDTVTRYIRIAAVSKLNVTDDADTDGDEVKGLVGVNNDVAHRLMEEDVETILSLAKCDPIRVMMRTNLDFDVVLDLMDQAIVATAITPSGSDQADGPQKKLAQLIDVLRASGLSRASQIRDLMDRVSKQEEAASNLLTDLANAAVLAATQLNNLFSNIAEDSRTEFVCRLLAPPPEDKAATLPPVKKESVPRRPVYKSRPSRIRPPRQVRLERGK